MNSPLVGVKSSWDRLCVRIDILILPSPPPYHMTGVWRELPPSFILAGMMAYFLNRVLSIVLSVPRIAITWTCD
jgi:hypothetical protein